MELGNAIFGHSRGHAEVPRQAGYEQHVERLFAAIGLDAEGYERAHENDTFAIRPYHWGDCTCPDDDRDIDDADPACEAHLPNLHHKPSGYVLRWYKYPLRDSYANRAITVDEFRAMIDECVASVAR